jgi:luciferase family oxidoreductase group 1
MKIPLGILDQSPIPEGSIGGDALRNSIDLAVLADSLGYSRYWVAEHHGTPGLACASPEVLIPLLAAATKRIRVGSGGIMLPHYSPLKVAETFSMLAGLFPDRIDLGIGRAAGTDPATARALQRDRYHQPPDDFEDQLAELLNYFTPGNRLALRSTLPGAPQQPAPYLLGSSMQSALWAAERALPYVFADFINANGASIAARYRDTFRPSETLAAPHVGVAAWTVCAPTDEEARDLAAPFQMMMIQLFRGVLIPVPTIEKAKEFLAAQDAPPDRLGIHRRLIAGNPATVAVALEALAAEYKADELLLVNILHDHQARRRSYELVAQAFRLQDRYHPPA